MGSAVCEIEETRPVVRGTRALPWRHCAAITKRMRAGASGVFKISKESATTSRLFRIA